MSYTQAWALLDRVRNGESVPLADINTAWERDMPAMYVTAMTTSFAMPAFVLLIGWITTKFI